MVTELILKEKLSTPTASSEATKEASSNDSVVAEGSTSSSSMQSSTSNANDVTTVATKTGLAMFHFNDSENN